jgi:hypothetical protein
VSKATDLYTVFVRRKMHGSFGSLRTTKFTGGKKNAQPVSCALEGDVVS